MDSGSVGRGMGSRWDSDATHRAGRLWRNWFGREEWGGWQAADLGEFEVLVIHSSVLVECSPRGPPWPRIHDSLQGLARLGTDLATSSASLGHLHSEVPIRHQAPLSCGLAWNVGHLGWDVVSRQVGSEPPRKAVRTEQGEGEAPRKNLWKAAREAGENPAGAWMSASASQEDPSQLASGPQPFLGHLRATH